jgi:hypothetical protein
MIKGLSDRIKIARLGKIHLGEKKSSSKSGNLYPSATDYFVVHEDANTPPEIVAKFHQIYGERPKELNIMFPLDEPEKFFPQWLKRYAGGTLVCKGDGEKAIETDPKTSERKERQCLYRDCPYYQKKQCKAVGNLQFNIVEIPGGVFQIDTSSYNSILCVNTAIKIIKERNGRIANIPLKLALRPLQVTVNGANGYPKTIYVLNLYQPLSTSVDNKPDTEIAENQATGDEPELPDSDDVPEDLFPSAISDTQYGPLEVRIVKTLQNKNTGEIFYGLTCVDSKGVAHTLISNENVPELAGKSLVEYRLEPVNDHLERLISYKVLEKAQEA